MVHTLSMIKPTKKIADVKQMVKDCSAQRVAVRVNLGRNKSISYSGVLSGIYPALFTVKPDDPVSPIIHICVNVDIQHIRAILKNVVCIPADDHTGAFVSKLKDHIALDVPKEISSGKSVHHAG